MNGAITGSAEGGQTRADREGRAEEGRGRRRAAANGRRSVLLVRRGRQGTALLQLSLDSARPAYCWAGLIGTASANLVRWLAGWRVTASGQALAALRGLRVRQGRARARARAVSVLRIASWRGDGRGHATLNGMPTRAAGARRRAGSSMSNGPPCPARRRGHGGVAGVTGVTGVAGLADCLVGGAGRRWGTRLGVREGWPKTGLKQAPGDAGAAAACWKIRPHGPLVN